MDNDFYRKEMTLEDPDTVKADADNMIYANRTRKMGSTLWHYLELEGYEYIPTAGWVNRKRNTQLIQQGMKHYLAKKHGS